MGVETCPALGMYWVALAIWAFLILGISGAPNNVNSNSIRDARQGPFGASIFDNEEFELSPIGSVEYEYTEEDYEEEVFEDLDVLYSEDFYGDYEEEFIEPIRNEVDYDYDESAVPFGNSIFNLDDIEKSPIADVEYEYDYEDYNYIDDTPQIPIKAETPIKKEIGTEKQTVPPETLPTKSIMIKSYPEIIYHKFKPIYVEHEKKLPSSVHPSASAPEFKPIHAQPSYNYRFTPAELQYMYGKPSQQNEKRKPKQIVDTNPFTGLVKHITTKVGNIVRFVTETIRSPKKLFI